MVERGGDWLRADADAPERESVVPVLDCNWDALQVYQHCQQSVVGAGFGIIHLGVAASECRAAIALLRPPRTRHAQILDGVQQLGQYVATDLNRRARR